MEAGLIPGEGPCLADKLSSSQLLTFLDACCLLAASLFEFYSATSVRRSDSRAKLTFEVLS